MQRQHQTPLTLIIIGRNCERAVKGCLGSLLSQACQDWECIIVDDHSDDETYEIARSITECDPRFRLLRTSRRSFKAACFDLALELTRPNSIIAELDLDDHLSSSDAVGAILCLHVRYDVVWTQHVTVNRSPRPWTMWRSTPLPRNWNRRTAGDNRVWSKDYFPGHLRTFKRYLIDQLNRENWLYNGMPVKVAFDMVYYTAILEVAQSGTKCFYNKDLYTYNVWPNNDDFTEVDLKLDGLAHLNPDMCQSAMDSWFKREAPNDPISGAAIKVSRTSLGDLKRSITLRDGQCFTFLFDHKMEESHNVDLTCCSVT